MKKFNEKMRRPRGNLEVIYYLIVRQRKRSQQEKQIEERKRQDENRGDVKGKEEDYFKKWDDVNSIQ